MAHSHRFSAAYEATGPCDLVRISLTASNFATGFAVASVGGADLRVIDRVTGVPTLRLETIADTATVQLTALGVL